MDNDVLTLSTRITSTAAGTVLAAHGVPGGGPIVESLLRDLLGIQDQQLAAINKIDATVQRLADAPWATARLYIDEAALPGITPDQRSYRVQRAADALRDAIPKQPDRTFRRAYVCLDLALLEHMLAETAPACYYARLAAEAASGHTEDAFLAQEKAIKRLVAATSPRVAKVARFADRWVIAGTDASRALIKLGMQLSDKIDRLDLVLAECKQILQVATTLCSPEDPQLAQVKASLSERDNIIVRMASQLASTLEVAAQSKRR